jgi:hypothetical protein
MINLFFLVIPYKNGVDDNNRCIRMNIFLLFALLNDNGKK